MIFFKRILLYTKNATERWQNSEVFVIFFFVRPKREWLYELLEMWVIDRDIRDILGQEWYGEDMIEVWEGEIKMLQKLKK